MSTTIKYKNLFGEDITIHQAKQFQNEYEKVSNEDSEIRTREFFEIDNSFSSVVFYLKPGENLIDFVTDAASKYGGGGFYFNKQIANNYVTWDIEYYENLTKVAKAKGVYNDLGEKVAYQTIDATSNEVLKTYKYFQLKDFGLFSDYETVMNNGLFEFYYNYPSHDPGEIFVIINLLLHIDASGGGYTLDSNENIFLEDSTLSSVFNWEDHPYYHSASPLIPTSPTI